MQIYNTTRWKHKRQHILLRDKYLCQECLRFGKRVDADTVHHIYVADIYTEYAYSDFNLISLCNACHNAMHDRDSHELTSKGLRLKEKTKMSDNNT